MKTARQDAAGRAAFDVYGTLDFHRRPRQSRFREFYDDVGLTKFNGFCDVVHPAAE